MILQLVEAFRLLSCYGRASEVCRLLLSGQDRVSIEAKVEAHRVIGRFIPPVLSDFTRLGDPDIRMAGDILDEFFNHIQAVWTPNHLRVKDEME